MLEDVKLALRISHDKADTEIKNLINAALADMIRAGAASSVVCAENPLAKRVVITYCRRELTDDTVKHQRFHRAYEQMLDELRRSGDGYLHRDD